MKKTHVQNCTGRKLGALDCNDFWDSLNVDKNVIERADGEMYYGELLIVPALSTQGYLVTDETTPGGAQVYRFGVNSKIDEKYECWEGNFLTDHCCNTKKGVVSYTSQKEMLASPLHQLKDSKAMMKDCEILLRAFVEYESIVRQWNDKEDKLEFKSGYIFEGYLRIRSGAIFKAVEIRIWQLPGGRNQKKFLLDVSGEFKSTNVDVKSITTDIQKIISRFYYPEKVIDVLGMSFDGI